jgi:hypothetical protein
MLPNRGPARMFQKPPAVIVGHEPRLDEHVCTSIAHHIRPDTYKHNLIHIVLTFIVNNIVDQTLFSATKQYRPSFLCRKDKTPG